MKCRWVQFGPDSDVYAVSWGWTVMALGRNSCPPHNELQYAHPEMTEIPASARLISNFKMSPR